MSTKAKITPMFILRIGVTGFEQSRGCAVGRIYPTKSVKNERYRINALFMCGLK